MWDKSFRSNILSIVVLSSFLFGCVEDKRPLPELPKDINTVAVSSPTAIAPLAENPLYVYSGDQFRDPFIPSGVASNYQADAIFDPQKGELKGLLFGESANGAIIVLLSGGTYYIKNGRIFDVMGKTVEGFTARISSNKVVIYGEGDSVYELKMKDDNQEETA